MKQPTAQDYLIVDGYNMVGAWPSLRKLAEVDFDAARDQLIDRLADYKGHSSLRVVVVFDAHFADGIGATYESSRVEVHFTKSKETADEYIEKFVFSLLASNENITVHVATSDHLQQRIVFGKGAYRMPALELERLTTREKVDARKKMKDMKKRNALSERLNQSVLEKLDRLRKGIE